MLAHAGGSSFFNSVLADSSHALTPGTNDDLLSLSASNLKADDGTTVTGVGLTIGSVGGDNEVGTQGSNTLLYDYVFNHSAGNNVNATLTITGLTPGAAYNLYFYTDTVNQAAPGTNLPHLTVAGASAGTYASSGIYKDYASNGGNTLYFPSTIANGSGNFVVTMGASTNVLSGFTISQVPEPSSVVLLTLGIAGVIGCGCVRKRGVRA